MVPFGIKKLGVGGRDLTDYLIKQLKEKEICFTTAYNEREIACDIKVTSLIYSPLKCKIGRLTFLYYRF